MFCDFEAYYILLLRHGQSIHSNRVHTKISCDFRKLTCLPFKNLCGIEENKFSVFSALAMAFTWEAEEQFRLLRHKLSFSCMSEQSLIQKVSYRLQLSCPLLFFSPSLLCWIGFHTLGKCYHNCCAM